MLFISVYLSNQTQLSDQQYLNGTQVALTDLYVSMELYAIWARQLTRAEHCSSPWYSSYPGYWCSLQTGGYANCCFYLTVCLTQALLRWGPFEARLSPIEMHMRLTAVWAWLWARQNACQLRKFCTFWMQFLGDAHRNVMQKAQSLAWQLICPIACILAERAVCTDWYRKCHVRRICYITV